MSVTRCLPRSRMSKGLLRGKVPAISRVVWGHLVIQPISSGQAKITSAARSQGSKCPPYKESEYEER